MPDDNRLPTNQSLIDLKESIDLLTANINRTASNIPYDSNLTIKAAIDGKVSKSGDTMTGNLNVNRANTGTSNLNSVITAGNNIPVGTMGSSRGMLALYGYSDKQAIIYPEDLTVDRYIAIPDKSGTMALTSDLGVCDELLAQTNIPASTPTSYNCDWSSYYFLSIEAIQYGNVVAQILIPTSYFNTTNSGNRPVITNPLNNMAHSIYKNGNSAVYITASSAVSSMGIRIYGVMKK